MFFNLPRVLNSWINYKNLRRISIRFIFSIALIADVIVSALYYQIEGSLPLAIHIASIVTSILLALPIYLLTLHFLKSLEEKQNTLQETQKQQASTAKKLKERNIIFQSLLDASISMQQSSSISALFDRVLKDLEQVFTDCGFGILVYGSRETSVQNFCATKLLAEEQSLIIENIRLLSSTYELTEKLNLITKNAYQKNSSHDWIFIPLLGSENKKLGCLIIKKPALRTLQSDVISLFAEQIAVSTENRLLLLELERLANTDSLTGIYNRNFFQKKLDGEVSKANKNKNIHFSIFVIDINGLKRINDTYGHEEGDKLIVAVANLLRRTFRDSDIITRSGGDEFVVLCPNTKSQDALGMLSRIRAVEKSMTLAYHKGSNTHQIEPVRVSIGVACSTETNPERVFSLADENMYNDKRRFYANNNKYR